MLISLVGALNQAGIGVGRVTCLSSVIISSVSYVFKMTMLISLIGTLTQTRMDIDRVTFYA